MTETGMPSDFVVGAILRVVMLLCGCFVIWVGAKTLWKHDEAGQAAGSASTREGEVKITVGKFVTGEFRQVTTGVLIIFFGAAMMLVAINKPLTHAVRDGGAADEVAAIAAPENYHEDVTVSSPAPAELPEK